MSDRLLEAHEVAELLAVPVSWVRAETRAGRMPHLALGRYKRYSWPAVLDWLEEQRGGQWRKHQPPIPTRGTPQAAVHPGAVDPNTILTVPSIESELVDSTVKPLVKAPERSGYD